MRRNACSGPPERFEVWDCLDCSCAWFVGVQERHWLIRLAALLMLIRNLVGASDKAGSPQRPCEADASIEASVAPARRHRFEAHRAAFEHGLQPVDAMIALSEAIASAEGIGRAVAHAQGPAASGSVARRR